MVVRVVFSALVILFCNVICSVTEAQNPAGVSQFEALPAITLPTSAIPNLEPPSVLPTIFKRVDEVNLVLSVTNDHGHFVRDLNQSDLVITDNGEPPAKITYFQTRTDLPLHVASVIDASDSVAYRFAFELKSAAAFLKNVLRPKEDAALIVAFNQQPTLVEPLTNDISKLGRGLKTVKVGGETALYDAIALASDNLVQTPEPAPVRRVIVLVTDGEENRSHISLSQAVEHALRAESVIYVVNTKEYPVSREDRFGEDVINRLAQSTGGRVLAGRSESDVSDSFRKIQEELRSQYAIGYRPRNLIGDFLFRPIRIFGPKGIRIRTREGYYSR